MIAVFVLRRFSGEKWNLQGFQSPCYVLSCILSDPMQRVLEARHHPTWG